jgi:bifunctional DNA-binding transcriptional regulator/antitoxin component of YhaV-PrlF toxin-antitoxin module
MDSPCGLVKIPVKVVKVGNSKRVAIPSEVAKIAKIEEGDTLLIDYDERARQITLEKQTEG